MVWHFLRLLMRLQHTRSEHENERQWKIDTDSKSPPKIEHSKSLNIVHTTCVFQQRLEKFCSDHSLMITMAEKYPMRIFHLNGYFVYMCCMCVCMSVEFEKWPTESTFFPHICHFTSISPLPINIIGFDGLPISYMAFICCNGHFPVIFHFVHFGLGESIDITYCLLLLYSCHTNSTYLFISVWVLLSLLFFYSYCFTGRSLSGC